MIKIILDFIIQSYDKAILDRKIQAVKAEIEADDQLLAKIRTMSRAGKPRSNKSGYRCTLEEKYQSIVAEKEAWILLVDNKQTSFITPLNEQLALLQKDARPWQQAVTAGWLAVGKVAIAVVHLSGIKEHESEWQLSDFDPPGSLLGDMKGEHRVKKMKEVQEVAEEIIAFTEKFAATVAEIDNQAAVTVNGYHQETTVFANNYIFDRDLFSLIDNIEAALKLYKGMKQGLQAVVERFVPKAQELKSRVIAVQAEKNRFIENY